jgi:hypothetical protein
VKSKHTITFIVVAILALLVTACNAAGEANTVAEPVASPAPLDTDQGQDFQRPGRGPDAQGQGPMAFMNIISEATDLDIATIREQSAGGATLAEIITANGGDVEAVKFEFINFAPTAVDGLPDSVTLGEAFSFQITGNLTIRDITNQVTFEATVTPVSETRLEGAATATIQRGDYNLAIPNVPNVADVSEDVQLEVDFVATAS